MTPTRKQHFTAGPGLKILDKTRTWYGPGYCGICGTSGEALIPQAVRFWDPDDGWTMGVLCYGCGEEAPARGPHADDYAIVMSKGKDNDMRIDVDVYYGDLDATYTNHKDN